MGTARRCDVKERPILFSGPMVRAILEGRKTQTRRVKKPQPIDLGVIHIVGQIKCPYGQPGDRLWVRETFCPDWCDEVIYRADDPTGRAARDAGYSHEPKWKPSIFMPRWASRIDLEVVGIRAERLQEISEDDALAEGCEPGGGACSGPMDPVEYDGYTASDEFAALWDSINAKRGHSWESNPWVWVVEFKRVT